MPFDKTSPAACEPKGRFALLVAALFVLLALLAAHLALRLPASEETGGPVHDLMESEAVIAFLGLDGEE